MIRETIKLIIDTSDVHYEKDAISHQLLLNHVYKNFLTRHNLIGQLIQNKLKRFYYGNIGKMIYVIHPSLISTWVV